MNATTASPMAPILQVVNTMIMNKGAYEVLAENMQKKLSESVPQASKPEFQEQMNKTHAAYIDVIQRSLTNLKTQYDLGSKLVENLSNCTELPQALKLLQEFQTQIAPLQVSFKQYEEQVATLEGKIVSLMPIKTTLDA